MKTTTNRRHRISRRTAVATVAFMSIAVPAAASVIIQNFIKADIEAATACFTKLGGSDATNFSNPASTGPYAKVDVAPTITVGGVDLINETVTVRGFAGDRTRYTDVIRYKNNCDHDLKIILTAEADAAGTAVTTGWTGMVVKGYLSLAAAPVTGTDLTNAAVWNEQFTISSAGVATNGSTEITVAAGSELQGAFSADVDVAATVTQTFHYTATATVA